MTKPFIQYLALLFLVHSSIICGFASVPDIDARGNAAAIFHLDKERFLYAKNLDAQIYPASMTKIATALYILRCHSYILQQSLSVSRDAITTISAQTKKQSLYRSPPHWLETDGVTIQLKYKEEMLGEDLFRALLICSANDAANVLAASCCASVPAFMEALNQFLRTIGCTHTHFNNPHGLHHPNHVTTVQDLTMIMKEALKEPLFLQTIQTTSYTIPATNVSDARSISTTNKLIQPSSTYYYLPCIGGKTGSTKSAGKNIIIAAEKHNRPLIVVASGYQGGSECLYQDVIALCESIFNETPISQVCIPPKGTYRLHSPLYGEIKIPLPSGLSCNYFASESRPPVSVFLKADSVTFPIQEGAHLGVWIFKDAQGNIVSQEDAYADTTISLSIYQKLRACLLRIFSSIHLYICMTLIGIYLQFRRARRTRKTSRFRF